MENENYIKEKHLNESPSSIPVEALEILIPKIKTSICKIKCNDGGSGTGFFCNISDNWTTLKVLMTNNHVLNKDDISMGKKVNFSINNERVFYEIKIDETRKIYTDKKYDVTINELKRKDNLDKISFFDIDDRIFKENTQEIFKNMGIFLLHYPKGTKMEYSMGLIKLIGEDNYTIRHSCDSSYGSSGSPIINSINFQVIGIHIGGAEGAKQYNMGSLLKEPIKNFNDNIEIEQSGENESIKNSKIENNKKDEIEDNKKDKNQKDKNENNQSCENKNISKEDIKENKNKKNEEYTSPIIILDNHSNILKIGLSSDNMLNNVPIYQIPALLGFSFDEYAEEVSDLKLQNLSIKRDETTLFRSLLQLTNPTKEWFYTSEKDTVDLLNILLINKLKLLKNELSNKKILLTDGPKNTNKNRMKIGEILFEKIGFGYFNIESQAKMALFANGLSTGVVLDIGDEITNIIPIAEGCLLKDHINKIDCGGNNIIEYFLINLQKKGYDLHPRADFLIGRELTKKYCFVSCDISSDRKLYEETTYYNSFYQLPDGREIIISKEKFEAPEILFQPYNIHKILYNSIKVRIIFINI